MEIRNVYCHQGFIQLNESPNLPESENDVQLSEHNAIGAAASVEARKPPRQGIVHLTHAAVRQLEYPIKQNPIRSILGDHACPVQIVPRSDDVEGFELHHSRQTSSNITPRFKDRFDLYSTQQAILMLSIASFAIEICHL